MRKYAFGLLLHVVLPFIAVSTHLDDTPKAGTKEVLPHPIPLVKNADLGGRVFMASGSLPVPGVVNSGTLQTGQPPPFIRTSSFNGDILSPSNPGSNIVVGIEPTGNIKGGIDVPAIPTNKIGVPNSSTFGNNLALNSSSSIQSRPQPVPPSSGIRTPLPNTGLGPKNLNSPLFVQPSLKTLNPPMNNEHNNSNMIQSQRNTIMTTPLPVSTIRTIPQRSTTGPAIYNPAITTASLSQSFGHPTDFQSFFGTGKLGFAAPPNGLVGREPREPSSGPEHEFELSAFMPNMHPKTLFNSFIQNPGVPPGNSVIRNSAVPPRSSLIRNPGIPQGSSLIQNPGVPPGSSFIPNPRVPPGSSLIQNPRVLSGSSLIQNPGAPTGSSLIQNPGVPPGSSLIQNPGAPTESSLIQNLGVPPGSSLIQNPGVPPGSSLIQNPGLPPGSSLKQNPGLPSGNPLIQNPGVPPGSPLIQNPGVPPGISNLLKSSQLNNASPISGLFPPSGPVSETGVGNGALNSQTREGSALDPALAQSPLQPISKLSPASNKPMAGILPSRNPTGMSVSSASKPSLGPKAGVSYPSQRQTRGGAKGQQSGFNETSTVKSSLTLRTTTRQPTSRPSTTTSRPTTTTRRATTTSVPLWEFILTPTTAYPFYDTFLQHFMVQSPPPPHYGFPAPSDCDCNRKHDSCPPGKYPVGECQDGIRCCDTW